jgi:3-isopropylmalate dehydrogenase
MAAFTVAVLPGDGIGPEVVAEGLRVLRAVGERFGHTFQAQEALIGGCAIDATGSPLPEETLALCRTADAVLLGAVGGPRWSDPQAPVRPEQGLLDLRQALHLFANLRPVRVYPGLEHATPLRPEVVAGTDLVIVRELSGGLYYGKPQGMRQTAQGREAVDTLFYREQEVRRLLRVAFDLARGRRKKLTSVDKANVLASSRLWREVAHEVARDYPDVAYEDLYVDACAMHLVRRPTSFDVLATENMFGDILSDEAAVLAGSLGMLPSASLGAERRANGLRPGLYEPVHGSAPDIAGKGIANPLGTILSVALMLRLSFGLEAEARAVEGAVEAVLAQGFRTPDVMSPGMRQVGTRELGERVAEAVCAASGAP